MTASNAKAGVCMKGTACCDAYMGDDSGGMLLLNSSEQTSHSDVTSRGI